MKNFHHKIPTVGNMCFPYIASSEKRKKKKKGPQAVCYGILTRIELAIRVKPWSYNLLPHSPTL